MQLRVGDRNSDRDCAISTRLRKPDKKASYVLRRTNMIINYSFFQKGHSPHDRYRFARFPFRSDLKIDHAGKTLFVRRSPTAIAEERETHKTLHRAEIFRQIWSLVRHGPELMAGTFSCLLPDDRARSSRSITFLHLRPLIRDAGSDRKADAYLPANRSLLWRR